MVKKFNNYKTITNVKPPRAQGRSNYQAFEAQLGLGMEKNDLFVF